MHIFGRLSLAGVSAISLAMPALAQDAANQPSAEDEALNSGEIVVAARRRDENLQDVPVVVNAVTSEAIEKLNLRKFEDITSVVPGLSLASNANGIGVTATVRGINYDVNVSGNNGTIQFYQNDVPVPAGLMFNALFDVGQVEVLRGPQGTLKGRSAPSGAITLYTRRPDLARPGMNANVTINDRHGWNGNGALNIPIIEDKFAVRLAGVVTDGRGNFVRDLVDSTEPSDKTQGIRASAKADPFDGLIDLDFTYQDVHRKAIQFDQVESANIRFAGFGASPVTIRARDRLSTVGTARTTEQQFTTYDAQGRLHLAGQALTYLYGRSEQHLQVFAPSDVAGVFAVDSAGGNRFGQPTDSRSKNTSHEIRLQNEERVLGMFDYVAGALIAKGSSDTFFQSATGIALGAPFANPPRLVSVVLTPIRRFGTNKETSFFGNLTAHIGEDTEISGGVRRIKYSDTSGLSISGVVNPSFSLDFTEKKTIYNASVKHNFTRDLMVYASTGSSFRPSTIAIGGPTDGLSALQASFLETGPETSKSYEIGVKSSWFDRTLKVNVTGFHQKFKNYPYRSSSGVFAIDRSNTANPSVLSFNYVAGVPVKVKGVEAELAYTPSERFNIGGNVSYSKGTISNGTVACLDLNNDGVPDVVNIAPTLAQLQADVGAANIDSCQVGFNANLSSRWGASVQSEYKMPVGASMEGYVRGLYNWKGNSQNDPVNAFDNIKSYGLLNLYAGIRDEDGRWEVSLYGKNVTNTFRVLNRSNGLASTPLRGGIPLGGPVTSSGSLSTTNYFSGPSGQGGLSVTEPREFGINLRLAIGSR